jgi:hypothetical protein
MPNSSKRRQWAHVLAGAAVLSLGTAQAGAIPASMLEQPTTIVLQSFENITGRRCGYFGPYMARCAITDAASVDFDLPGAGGKYFDRAVIYAEVEDRDRVPSRYQSARPGAIRAFGCLFPNWPGARFWIARAYDKALAAKTRADLHLYGDKPIAGLPYDSRVGPPQTITRGGFVVHVFKDFGPIDRDQLYVYIDIRQKTASEYREDWVTSPPPGEY